MNVVKEKASALRRMIILAGVVLSGLAGAGWLVWHVCFHPAKLRYSSQGYGGYVAVSPSRASVAPIQVRSAKQAVQIDPVQAVRHAYDDGRYADVSLQADKIIRTAVVSPSLSHKREAAFARQVLAYSVARQAIGSARKRDLIRARAEFASLETDAEQLPDRGVEAAPPGEIAPTLQAEAAFQHGVCTGALGDRAGAEAEYVAFIRRFPQSSLVHAAVVRLQQLHGGDLTHPEEAAREWADGVTLTQQKLAERESSLCGPECLAELLRRRGKAADVHALADEMGTSDRGTSMAALARVADRYGFSPQGLAVTQEGLELQNMPVIALTKPGHYVIIDQARADRVTVWDPDAFGVGHGGSRTIGSNDWKRSWDGITLALTSVETEVRTASR